MLSHVCMRSIQIETTKLRLASHQSIHSVKVFIPPRNVRIKSALNTLTDTHIHTFIIPCKLCLLLNHDCDSTCGWDYFARCICQAPLVCALFCPPDRGKAQGPATTTITKSQFKSVSQFQSFKFKQLHIFQRVGESTHISFFWHFLHFFWTLWTLFLDTFDTFLWHFGRYITRG